MRLIRNRQIVPNYKKTEAQKNKTDSEYVGITTLKCESDPFLVYGSSQAVAIFRETFCQSKHSTKVNRTPSLRSTVRGNPSYTGSHISRVS